MATWEDGPQYAPDERPSAFRAPDTAPLDAAPPVPAPSAGLPADPPSGYDVPQTPGRALRDLAPQRVDVRDPQQPFSVASAAMTSSAWGAAHSAGSVAAIATAPMQPIVVSGTGAGPMGTPAAVGGSVASPASAAAPGPAAAPASVATIDPSAFPPPAAGSLPVGTFAPPPPGAAPVHGHFPAPGTPQWFGPGQAPAQPRIEASLANDLRAATYGLLITLLVGGLIPFVAPATLGVAAWLAGRVRFRRDLVRKVFLGAVALVMVALLVPLLSGSVDAEEMWNTAGFVACLASWVVAAFTLLQQHAGIEAGEQPAEPF